MAERKTYDQQFLDAVRKAMDDVDPFGLSDKDDDELTDWLNAWEWAGFQLVRLP